MRLINFQQHCKTIQWGKNNLFNKMMLGQLCIHSAKEWNCTSYLIPSSKFNSKWIKDLRVRAKTEELLEPLGPPGKTLRKKYRCKSSWPWTWQWFLRYNIKRANNQREKQIRRMSSKFKTFLLQGPHQEIKDNPQNGRKFLQII